MAIKRVSFRVDGRVQGVFFRHFTKTQADSYGLTGWVHNTDTGKVQGEAQGDDEAVQKLVKDLERGPPAAHVEHFETMEMKTKDDETSFEVFRGRFAEKNPDPAPAVDDVAP